MGRPEDGAWSETDSFFRVVVESMLDTVLVVDAEGHVHYTSPILARSGFTPEQFRGLGLWGFIHPADAERVRGTIRSLAAAPDGQAHDEVRFSSPLGGTRHGEWAMRHLRPGYVLLYGRDVTARHDAEAAIVRTNQVLAAIAAVKEKFIRAPDGKAAFERLLGAVVAMSGARHGTISELGESGERRELARSAGDIAEGASRVVIPVHGGDGDVLAVVDLSSDAPVEPSSAPLALLLGTCATLIESSRERRRREDAEDDARLLRDLAIAVVEAPDLTSALRVLLHMLCERTGWDVAQAWTLAFAADSLECSPAWYSSGDRFAPLRMISESLRFRLGESAAGEVWATGEVRRWSIPEISDAAKFPRLAVAHATGLRCCFMVPVLADGKFVAVLEFGSIAPRREDDRLLDLVAVCARHVGWMLERKRVELSNASLGIVVRSLNEAVAIVSRRDDPAGQRFLYANPAFARMMGYADASDVLGLPPGRHFGKGTDPEARQRIVEVLSGGSPARETLMAYRVDGSEIELELSCSPVVDGDGERAMTVVLARDVGLEKREDAKRRALEVAVQNAREAWRQTFDAIDLPVALIDANMNVRRVNRAAQDLAGLPYADLVGRSLESFGTREPWAAARALGVTFAATGKAPATQATDPETGTAWEVALTPATHTDGTILVAHDITATLHLQESLRRTETMAALGRIVAGVAHEVRNPLFGIGATLDAFEVRFGAATDHARHLAVLRGEVARLTMLMHDLLDYGRPPGLSRAPCSLPGIVDEAISHCASRANNAGVTVRWARPSTPCVASVDRSRVLSVVINLIENAIQHSPRGSTVGIDFEADEATQRASLRVEDEGPGFATADLPRIFEPFFTKRRDGTGLGLSIVQRIVEQHGGQVLAVNRPTRGAAMTVHLPLGASHGG